MEDPTDRSFARVLIADYLLEAIYFYNGFNFFYLLASRNKMMGTSDIIKLINREMNYGDDKFFNVPDNQNMIEQYLLFLHRDEIGSFISPRFDDANIVVRNNITSSAALAKTIKRLNKEIEKVIDPYFKFKITSEGVLINKAGDSIAVSSKKSPN